MWKEDELVGFVIFYIIGYEWVLDLMCIVSGVFDGMMYLMVNEVILMVCFEEVLNVFFVVVFVLLKDNIFIEGCLCMKYFEKVGGKGLC